MMYSPFHFKKFSVFQEDVAHPVGTDGVLLGAWADTRGVQSVLDIGTGTGLIALMMAQRSDPEVRITAVEFHSGSVICARENFNRSPWAEKLELFDMPVQQFAANSGRLFDLIVSNPPFFSERTVSPDAARSMGRHTGTLPMHELVESILKLLSPEGRCCMVLPEKEGKQLCELSAPLGLFCTQEVQVRSRAGKAVERLLLQLERDPRKFQREILEIYGEDGAYSVGYQGLTRDFYLAL